MVAQEEGKVCRFRNEGDGDTRGGKARERKGKIKNMRKKKAGEGLEKEGFIKEKSHVLGIKSG